MYTEVLISERLVFSMILSDEHGCSLGSDEAGKTDDWPEELVTTVTFESIGKQTKVSNRFRGRGQKQALTKADSKC